MIRSHTWEPSGSRPSVSAWGPHVEDALVVPGQDEGEAGADVVPVREQPSGDGGVGPLPVLDEQVVHDLLVARAAARGRPARC